MDDPTVVEVKKGASEEPTLFGARYRPIALLGSGGMGSVYLTRDMQLDELVAVKILRSDLAASMLERFRDEVRLARRVTNPFVARTHDLAEHEGRFFVTMQYVEGETLSAVIRRKGRLSVEEIMPIARDLCEGLAAVHAAEVVHRDLKPANVMMTKVGRAMLTDFGIALRADTAHGRTDGYGTPTYTAPEQLAGKAVDARADIYALGATLYALATGQRPFSGARTGREPPPDPRRERTDVPDALAALVMRAMQIEPGDRFASCEAVRAAVDALRPPTTETRASLLRGFVRGLSAGSGRRVAMTFEAHGVASSLGEAVRGDLVARLNARGRVRVVDASDVEARLDARFARVDDQCSLSLRLESADDRYVFWSDALEGPLHALPQLLEHASNEIERAFVPTSMPAAPSSAFESAEIASLFLEGRQEYRGFWAKHVKKSIELFEKARALAPDHPLILAWCAAAHARHRFFDTTSNERNVGRELAERALELAPELPEVYVSLATANMQDLRMTEAVPHYVKALRLAPGLLEQHVAFARLLSECGAVEPSLALLRGAFEVDPTYFEPVEVVVRHHALRGRLDLAAREAERAINAKDTFIGVAIARYSMWYHDRERFDATCARIGGELDAHPRMVMDVYDALFTGARPNLETLTKLEASGAPRRRVFFKQMRAEICAFRRDEEGTLDALEEAVDLGFFDVQWFDLCPLVDSLRGTLRFEALHQIVRARSIAVLTEVERCLGQKIDR